MFPKKNATVFPRMNANMCPNKYPKRNAAKFPKKWPRKCVVTVHLTRFIKANDQLSQNLQNMVMDQEDILHPPITVRLYMKKNVKPSMSKSAILNTRKSAIRSPPLMGMGLTSPNPSANMSQWKNAKMFPKQNATMFPRMNAKMWPNEYPKRNAAKFPKKWPRKYVVTSHNAPKHHY